MLDSVQCKLLPAPAGRRWCPHNCRPPGAPGRRAACRAAGPAREAQAFVPLNKQVLLYTARGRRAACKHGRCVLDSTPAGRRAACAAPGRACSSCRAALPRPHRQLQGIHGQRLTSERGLALPPWHPRSARWAHGTVPPPQLPARGPAGWGRSPRRCGLQTGQKPDGARGPRLRGGCQRKGRGAASSTLAAAFGRRSTAPAMTTIAHSPGRATRYVGCSGCAPSSTFATVPRTGAGAPSGRNRTCSGGGSGAEETGTVNASNRAGRPF